MRQGDLGTAFGELAVEYNRVRPAWPNEAITRVSAALGITRNAPVADLGAGTGKLTGLLLQRFRQVWAIEPDERMRAVLAALRPRARIVDGTAEAIPLGDASLWAVFIADAFHWFDGARALSEIARVLRPGGGVVLLWNDWWKVEPPLPNTAAALLEEPFIRSGRAAASAHAGSWRDAFAAAPFTRFEEARFEWDMVLGARDLGALFMTTSSLASLPINEQLELRGRLLELLSGDYRLPITTRLYWARRIDSQRSR